MSSTRPDAKKVILFLTDGFPTFPAGQATVSDPGDLEAAVNAARVAHAAGIRINSYALGTQALTRPIAATEIARVTLGTFTDARIKAILPMAPRTMRRVDAVTLPDSYFQTVTVPTLIIGSELDMTDPFFVDAKRAFDNLPIGAELVGLAEVLDGGHNTFTDLCELQPEILDLVGGANEGCLPRHLPWKHAHDLINYLALNFFDGVLNGNEEALERLTPEAVGELEDLRFWRK